MLSKEVEEQLIKKIQGESGYNAGSKMIAMFKDIDLSKETADKFAAVKANQIEGIELQSVQILSNGAWPIDNSSALQVQYPTIMKMLYEKFNEWYKANFHNKKLTMLNQYGSCEVKALFNSKLIFTFNVVQTCILNKYNH